MARLNEVPTSLESLESLKRRFIRQNRELARSNSIQSVKIRNLEGEISRLLAENVTLSEEIIQLRTELEYSSGKQCASYVMGVKSQMEAKLQELSGMLAELGDLNRRPRRRKSELASPRQSPNRTARRRSVNLAELLAAQEGRLPTIMEDKSYPRRTLESREVQALLDVTGNDSPDIGPPPKSSFDCNGTEDFALAANTRQSYPPAARISDDAEIIPDLLAGNFDIDTRRRRRSSQKYAEPTAPEFTESTAPVESERGEEQIVRAGVKRKLAVRDLDESTTPAVTSTDQFYFSRKDSTSRGSHRSSLNNQSLEDSLAKLVLQPPSQGITNGIPVPGSPTRKILGTKPVNTDPVVISPEKSKANAKDIKKPENREEKTTVRIQSNKPRSRTTKAAEHYILPVETPAPMAETVEISLDNAKLEPKTPAPTFDAFSPASSRPSETPASKDTPPPPDFTAGGAQTTDKSAAGRTSRRARSNVSYAEPSLVSKMRRPTKTLVDAVVLPKDEGRGQGDNGKVESAVSRDGPPLPRTVLLTRNDSSQAAPHKLRQSEPLSPLRDRETDTLPQEVADPPQDDLMVVKQEPVEEALPQPQSAPQTAPSATLSALIASSQKRNSTSAIHLDPTPADAQLPVPSASNSTESIKSSTSNIRQPTSKPSTTASTTRAPTTTTRRRQTLTSTSTTKAPDALSAPPANTQSQSQSQSQAHARSRPSSLETSTSSSAVSSTATAAAAAEAKDVLPPSSSSSRSTIRDAGQTQPDSSALAGTTADVAKRRAERVAARRRSMML